ncbi:MAG: hypothetical protein ACRD22_17480, partial [Terriglobia bacterium]
VPSSHKVGSIQFHGQAEAATEQVQLRSCHGEQVVPREFKPGQASRAGIEHPSRTSSWTEKL